jgi:hypothetical protein
MKIGQETLMQMTNHDSSTYFPLCINDFHAFVPIINKFKMNSKEGFFYKYFMHFLFFW